MSQSTQGSVGHPKQWVQGIQLGGARYFDHAGSSIVGEDTRDREAWKRCVR